MVEKQIQSLKSYAYGLKYILISKMERIIDLELIEKAIEGDSFAFEKLYNKYKKRVYSICFRMLKNKEDAEDFTQEAFIQLYRKLGSFRGESAFSTWLHRLTVNLVLMKFRKKVMSTVSIDEDVEQNDNKLKFQYGVDDPVISSSIDRLTIERALNQLPPGYKTVFILHDIRGFEHNKIASFLGCTLGNSKSQLHKARMLLFKIINPEGNVREFSKHFRKLEKELKKDEHSKIRYSGRTDSSSEENSLAAY